MRGAAGGNDPAALRDGAVAAMKAAVTGDQQQAAAARDRAAEALAKAQGVPVEQARSQVAQYEKQYRDSVETAKREATEAAAVAAKAVTRGALFAALALVLGHQNCITSAKHFFAFVELDSPVAYISDGTCGRQSSPSGLATVRETVWATNLAAIGSLLRRLSGSNHIEIRRLLWGPALPLQCLSYHHRHPFGRSTRAFAWRSKTTIAAKAGPPFPSFGRAFLIARWGHGLHPAPAYIENSAVAETENTPCGDPADRLSARSPAPMSLYRRVA
jgi:hypothetical protein